MDTWEGPEETVLKGGEHPLWHNKSVANSRAVSECGWPLLLLLPTRADAH